MKSRTLRTSVAIACTALLVACAETSQIRTSAAPDVGSELMEPTQAAQLFADACIKTRPSYDGLRAALGNGPWVQSSATSTYFHQRLNLSVKAANGACSMVFAAENGDEGVIAKLALGTTLALQGNVPRDISTTSKVRSDGLRYYRMGITG